MGRPPAVKPYLAKPGPWLVAHRGGSLLSPENTLVAFDRAVALGADAIETDVHLTRDGVVVVFHDDETSRLTGRPGTLEERTLAEVRALDPAFGFTLDGGRSFPFREQRFAIPTLWEALQALPTIPLIIELKSVEVAAPALAVLRETDNLHRVLIGSFLDEALIPFQRAGVPVSPGSGTLTRLLMSATFMGVSLIASDSEPYDDARSTEDHQSRARTSSFPFQALCIPRFHHLVPLPVRGFAQTLRDAGGPTHIWTINDPARAAKLWRSGINGIISDDPALMLRTRETLQ